MHLRSNWNWPELIDAFCALGGVVENIMPRNGEVGAGLVAARPADPVLVRVPCNLLFRVADLEFTEGRIGIRKSTEIPEAERSFFQLYHTSCAWEAERRNKITQFIIALGGLPEEIQTQLIEKFGLGYLLQGGTETRIQTCLLRNREIPWRGGAVIAPVLELANHDLAGLRYERGKHLQIQGYVRDEVTIRRAAEDAYSTFHRFGAAEPQPVAFSLPMKARVGDREIVISRNTNEGVTRGGCRIPRSSFEGGTLTLSYLMLGHKDIPRQPRGIFRSLLRDAGIENADDVFDRIVRLNALKFIKLLQALEAHEGEMISGLRTMARYQLEAMAHCVGCRELSPVAT